jgi:hypothetical protein
MNKVKEAFRILDKGERVAVIEPLSLTKDVSKAPFSDEYIRLEYGLKLSYHTVTNTAKSFNSQKEDIEKAILQFLYGEFLMDLREIQIIIYDRDNEKALVKIQELLKKITD